VVPDDKDWTWVLAEVCPECGFDAGAFPADEVAGLVRQIAAVWTEALAGPPADLGRRPAPARWSPLEYGCHVRDVLRIYDERLRLMLTVDDPHYPNWDQDETAVAERYREQDPAVVAGELAEAAVRIADRFETVSGPAWLRTGARGDGARFTVDSFARYFVHDPVHHLWDVTGRPGGGAVPTPAGG
jgi:hypothetical protein